MNLMKYLAGLMAVANFALLAAYESVADTGWQDRSVLVDSLVAPVRGRFGFRYVVDDTSLNGHYVGIDAVSINAIPEPVTVALICLGAVGLLSRRLRPRRLLAAGALATGALAAQAGTPDTASGVMSFPHVQVQVQPVAPSAPGQDGFMAYKDPVTGKLTGPDPQQAALLTAAARTQMPIMRPLPPKPQPSHGGISLMLDERHARYAVARKAADGSIAESCVPEAQAQGERP
ncbi:post-PEP-CTERM-1 domain-containing protein [Duganella sp. PWIR1]